MKTHTFETSNPRECLVFDLMTKERRRLRGDHIARNTIKYKRGIVLYLNTMVRHLRHV